MHRAPVTGLCGSYMFETFCGKLCNTIDQLAGFTQVGCKEEHTYDTIQPRREKRRRHVGE